MFNRSYIEGHVGHSHCLTRAQIAALAKRIDFSFEEEMLLRIARHLSDPTKLKIYLLLDKVEEISVTDIGYILRLSQSTVSHALSDLKAAGIIESHRCGKLICYSLKKPKEEKGLLAFLTKVKTLRGL